MEYRIDFDAKSHVIHSTVEGDVTFDEAVDFITELILKARESKCLLFLTDFRGAIPKLSTTELYKLPEIIRDLMLSLKFEPGQVKRAMIVAQDTEEYRFFSAAIFQSGQMHKVFLDVEEAREWLLS